MYIKKMESGYRQYFHCDCYSLDHVVRISYWEDKVDKKQSITGKEIITPEISVEIMSTWWEQWYKRVWTAIKYVFRRDQWYYAGVSLSNKADVIRLRDMLNSSLKQWSGKKKDK